MHPKTTGYKIFASSPFHLYKNVVKISLHSQLPDYK